MTIEETQAELERVQKILTAMEQNCAALGVRQLELEAEKQAVTQSVFELMANNLNLKAANILVDRARNDIQAARAAENTTKDAEIKRLLEQNAAKDAEIIQLSNKLAVANAIVTQTTNLVPPGDVQTPAE
jgi:hypothetical protein